MSIHTPFSGRTISVAQLDELRRHVLTLTPIPDDRTVVDRGPSGTYRGAAPAAGGGGQIDTSLLGIRFDVDAENEDEPIAVVLERRINVLQPENQPPPFLSLAESSLTLADATPDAETNIAIIYLYYDLSEPQNDDPLVPPLNPRIGWGDEEGEPEWPEDPPPPEPPETESPFEPHNVSARRLYAVEIFYDDDTPPNATGAKLIRAYRTGDIDIEMPMVAPPEHDPMEDELPVFIPKFDRGSLPEGETRRLSWEPGKNCPEPEPEPEP